MVVQRKELSHGLVKKLHDNIERGDVLECEKLIKDNSIDLDTPLGKEHFTALHRACYYGHIECIHWLVWHTADINTKSIQGWTPAHVAAIRGKDQCLEALMSHQADLTLQDEGGQCPAHLAAAHGNTFTLRTMCRKGGDMEIRDINGWKPIHHAAHSGKLGCVQTLVKWGCSLETVTLVTGDTALHLAAAGGHLNVVKYIVSVVEDWLKALSSINNDAENPLEKSVVREQHEIVDYLSNLTIENVGDTGEEQPSYPLHIAATQGDLSSLKRMIGSGLYDINTRDAHQSTPAHKAAGHGQVDVLRWLIENGADVELVNASGESVKDVAKRFGRTLCVEELGGYSDDEDAETSPEETLARALQKVDVLEEELKDAKYAVQNLGGRLPDHDLPDRETVMSEAQELRELLEHERLKRERLEATVASLQKQLDGLDGCNGTSPNNNKETQPSTGLLKPVDVHPSSSSDSNMGLGDRVVKSGDSDAESISTISSRSSKRLNKSRSKKKAKKKVGYKPPPTGVFIKLDGPAKTDS